MFLFNNRLHAGEALSEKLSLPNQQEIILFAIPMGGIPVGTRIAHKYKLPLRVLLCKKIYAPESTTIGIGALLQDGHVILNKDLISFLGITRHDINECIKEASITLDSYIREFERCIEIKIPDLTGKTAVIIDDGIASGFTVLGALNLIRQKEPEQIIVATPVCSTIAIDILKSCDIKLVYLLSSDSTSFLVDDFYINFSGVPLEQVRSLLASHVELNKIVTN